MDHVLQLAFKGNLSIYKPLIKIAVQIEVFWIGCLKSMIKGWKPENIDEGEYRLQYTNQEVQDIVQTVSL